MSHAVEDAPYVVESIERLDSELAASCGSDNPNSISAAQAASCGNK